MGNHAVAKAMIDTATRVITTYPGSPTPEIAAAVNAVAAADRPYYFEYSLNEKVALEVATGASLNGHLSTVFFKSVGLNVASDSLIQLSLLELMGGMVVILGDDPGANSSQNEQDNRHFCRMSYIPMLEPATPQEAYDMYREAVRLSVAHHAPILLRLTTHVCHAREVVHVVGRPPEAPDWTPLFDPENGPYVPVARTVFPLKRRALEKLRAFAQLSDASPLQELFTPNGAAPKGTPKRGVIASAIPALAVLENLAESEQPLSVLKLGMTFPLPRRRLTEFLQAHDEVLIVEELDPVLETEIKALAWDTGSRCKIHSRTDPEQLMGELDPLRTYALLHTTWPEAFPALAPPIAVASPTEALAPRPPQMCPGCGHRTAFFAVKAALAQENDPITVLGIGCHLMGWLPPYELGQVLLSMGHSVSTGAGLSIGNDTRKVLAFMGDSTLFHAGLPGLINAVLHNHNVTLIIMDNGTTAMTGHQARAGTGEIGEKIPIPDLLKALGVKFIRDADTYNVKKLTEHLRDALGEPGFKVVIARHPCMLKFTREARKKRPGLRSPPITVNQETCNRAMVCLEQFGCPSFTRNEDGSVTVNDDLCIGDGSCMQVCPAVALERSTPGGAK